MHFIYAGATKMYHDFQEVFWWNDMKMDIVVFVAKCPNCQQEVMRFDKKGKISLRFIGTYRILKRVGNVAYELELPAELAVVYLVFHISLLRKCVGDPTFIVPLESVAVKDSLTYKEEQVEILYHQLQ
ncbi:hypothetical protein MTR67_012084 [Solanum verrucosum]|uniref:Tf2-1-like SH3-like domain-containing protein n=1 Tax=Solanum verrucosum TaxID=315347 RepID=A0AAF0TH68_SOLVR|nr:hypothetical protein MTR67_012084 [Solanum verrucosum]